MRKGTKRSASFWAVTFVKELICDNSSRNVQLNDGTHIAAHEFAQEGMHNGQNTRQTYAMFTWGGRMHPVPEDYEFPRRDITVRSIFDYWFDGDPAKNYQPFRKLKGFDLSSKCSKRMLSKASGVIKVLLKSGNVTETEVAGMNDFAERDRLFERYYMQMFHSLYPNSDESAFDRRRIGDLTYSHVYDLLHPKVEPAATRRITEAESDL